MDNILKNNTPIHVRLGNYENETYPACEESVNVGPTGVGYHNLTYVELTNGTGVKKIGPWHERDAYIYVGTTAMVPTVLINAHKGQTLDPVVSGAFTVLFANTNCFVLGINTTYGNSSCSLWEQNDVGNATREVCSDAFMVNCSSTFGWHQYRYNKAVCDLANVLKSTSVYLSSPLEL
uniref:Lipocalin n=1 Tax=Rhipicephalus zambeziensis TaxID=60191 RepID=A0A224YI61_9ACAR